jgi:hypothetical protein
MLWVAYQGNADAQFWLGDMYHDGFFGECPFRPKKIFGWGEHK